MPFHSQCETTAGRPPAGRRRRPTRRGGEGWTRHAAGKSTRKSLNFTAVVPLPSHGVMHPEFTVQFLPECAMPRPQRTPPTPLTVTPLPPAVRNLGLCPVKIHRAPAVYGLAAYAVVTPKVLPDESFET